MSTDIIPAGGALAVRPDQTEWTPAQSAVLRQSGISNQVTAEELSGFLHLCQRTQLDPFSRQIYLIGRWDKRAGREVYRPQTGIDGYRVVAHRAAGAASESFGYEDTTWCDAAGRWRDVWLSETPPAAAKVVVVRGTQRFPAVALFREYCQTDKNGAPTAMWRRMPAVMIAKCAEALALRMAFPHDLAGVYTAEEMGQADNPGVDEGTAPIRRLRQVKSEPDPWASDGPVRDWLSEAEVAEDTAAVRELWIAARDSGASKETLDRIAQIGREKVVPASAAAAEPVDAEVVEDDERTAAVDALRGAALAAGVADTLVEDFRQSYGVQIQNASMAQLIEMTELLAGAA